MNKQNDKLTERRKYIRLDAPISITYNIQGDSKFSTTTAKNISADGLRIETHDKSMKDGDILELKLVIPGAANPVHANGKVVWIKKVSLEDDAPCDLGIELVQIEEDNKNTFLKFLCDVLYNLK